MFSKEEALQIKKDFWIAFAEAYPRKWLLYNTKIKDVTFKFYVDNKKAQVILDIEPKDEEKRKIYYDKVESLKSILIEDIAHNLEQAKNLGMKTCWLENNEVFAKKDADKPYIDYKIKNLPSFLQEINILKAQ